VGDRNGCDLMACFKVYYSDILPTFNRRYFDVIRLLFVSAVHTNIQYAISFGYFNNYEGISNDGRIT